MRRLIIFAIRKRLGLKKNECFRFTNQKSEATYFFTEDKLMKIEYGYIFLLKVSLNWLLDEECKVIKLKDKGGNETWLT